MTRPGAGGRLAQPSLSLSFSSSIPTKPTKQTKADVPRTYASRHAWASRLKPTCSDEWLVIAPPFLGSAPVLDPFLGVPTPVLRPVLLVKQLAKVSNGRWPLDVRPAAIPDLAAPWC